MTHPYIDMASRRAAETPEIPHTTLNQQQLARIGREIATLYRAEKAEWERDILATRAAELAREVGRLMGKQASAGIDAQAAWDAIKAKADEEGAVHGSDVVAILRSMGAR